MGSITFYLDSTGQHGLVCAPNDQGNYQWGCYGTDIVGTSTAFGTGQANTNLILTGCSDRPIAASVCDDLVLNGYSDWYLPSQGDLQLMYTQLLLLGSAGLGTSHIWSSTQWDISQGQYKSFFNGYDYTNPKEWYLTVRAARSF